MIFRYVLVFLGFLLLVAATFLGIQRCYQISALEAHDTTLHSGAAPNPKPSEPEAQNYEPTPQEEATIMQHEQNFAMAVAGNSAWVTEMNQRIAQLQKEAQDTGLSAKTRALAKLRLRYATSFRAKLEADPLNQPFDPKHAFK